MNFPNIDGHFWVVRGGEIIDPIFPHYKWVCKVRGCELSNRSYIPAPELTQKIITKMFLKIVKVSTLDELCQTFSGIQIEPIEDRCFLNAVLEISKNGGELVFGSLGFKLKGQEGYFYEYGGEDWTAVKQFLK